MNNIYFCSIAHFPPLSKFLNAMAAKILPLNNHMKYINETSLQIIKSREGQLENSREQVGNDILLIVSMISFYA